MKKVDVSFVCDCCGAPLPQKFVQKNNSGNLYFDRHAYNKIILSPGCRVAFDITLEYEYNPDQKEFCPECRVDGLRKILSKLESELKEDNPCTK